MTLNFLKETIEFSWYDYCLFSFMLGSSAAIGVYFGYFSNKETTVKEYLFGGKSMTVFPISMSLLASQMSGVTVLAIPVDIYKYGAAFIISIIGIVMICLVTSYITMSVFHGLQITSIYEYLMLRFNRKVRIIASLLYIMNAVIYLPIVIYIPALAFTQVTSVNLHVINVVICGICIFYTTIGGLKAVVWTDALQFCAMFGAMVAVLFIGVNSIGGLDIVYHRARIGKRLDIDFNIDPTKRDTFWTILFGYTLQLMANVSVNQGFVQKCLAIPSITNVRKAILIYGCGTIFFYISAILTGLFMHARYYDCDPLITKQVQHNDQLLPYYIMDVAHNIQGLPGIFVAGVFCASLSTLSAQMNSLSGIIYEDFLSKLMPEDITQKRISNILKLIVVGVGITSTLLIFVVKHLGELFSLTVALSGITFGPLFGLFILGMVFPFANTKGAMVGSITSLILMSIIVTGNQIYKFMGVLSYPSKPLSIEGCPGNLSFVTINNNEDKFMLQENVPLIFKISHYYYVFIGLVILLAIALPVSWLTKSDKPIDRSLITPCMRWAIPKRTNTELIWNTNNDELVKLNVDL